MIFFTSDLHFFHKAVIGYDNRPFHTIEDMNSHLIYKWNSVVKEKDVVYVLGDFGFCQISLIKNILNSLNGRKILIAGNHDRHSHFQYIDAGFEAVYYEAVIKLGRKVVRLSHYPYKKQFNWFDALWERIKTGKDYKHINKKRPIKNKEDWLLHGHVHSGYELINYKKRQIHVGCFAWDYTPVRESQIHNLIDRGY